MNASNAEGNAKAQSHVVYALLNELVDGLRMKGQIGNGSGRWIELRYVLLSLRLGWGAMAGCMLWSQITLSREQKQYEARLKKGQIPGFAKIYN